MSERDLSNLLFANLFFINFYNQINKSINWQVIVRIVKDEKFQVLQKNEPLLNPNNTEHSIIVENVGIIYKSSRSFVFS